MKVISGISQFKSKIKNSVLAIGVFDGIHLGHKELISRAVSKAKEIKGNSIVMTFHPHPAHVLRPSLNLPLIVSIRYRMKLIEQCGVDQCLIMKFTKRFSHISPEKFLKQYIIGKIKPKHIFVGDDFRFGENRKGSLEYFTKMGELHDFKVHVLDAIKGVRGKISSTKIREYISQGVLPKAKKLLGRNVSLMGKVLKGDGRGKKLGYPTANIIPFNEILPPLGVYAVIVTFNNKKYKAVANIGYRPSFSNKKGLVVLEVNIFDFNKTIYDKEIIVDFIAKLRNEKKFKSREALVGQIGVDVQKAKKLLSKHKIN